MRNFSLFPEAQPWCSFADYQMIHDTVRGLGAASVLEFGPGYSTLAIIEGGATTIDICEDSAEWLQVYTERLKYPPFVRPFLYEWKLPLHIPGLHTFYDLAVVDGPHQTPLRIDAVRFAMERAKAVLVPTEDAGRELQSYLRPLLCEVATQQGWDYMVTNTGPVAGGYALLMRTT
jgi:hypothetical protein